MNHRERLKLAMCRKIPDRIPYDLKFSVAALDLFEKQTGTRNTFALIDSDYHYCRVLPPKEIPDFSPYFKGRVPYWPEENWNDINLQLVPETTTPPYPHFFILHRGIHINEWGEYRVFDPHGLYHRKIHPLDQPELSLVEVENFPYPDLSQNERFNGVEASIQSIHHQGFASAVFMEMTIFEKAWRIRGMENLLVDMIIRPAAAQCLLENIAIRMAYLAKAYAQRGVDIIMLGDDIGAETNMILSPRLWRNMIKPHLANVIDSARAGNGKVLIFYHSDGKIEPIIPDLIEIGVDILNPIQPEAVDIDWLKEEYGADLSFWGGIGVQTTMPFGSPEDVNRSVKSLIERAGSGGGLLVAPSHVIEHDVPWQNIQAFIEAMNQYGSYAQMPWTE